MHQMMTWTPETELDIKATFTVVTSNIPDRTHRLICNSCGNTIFHWGAWQLDESVKVMGQRAINQHRQDNPQCMKHKIKVYHGN